MPHSALPTGNLSGVTTIVLDAVGTLITPRSHVADIYHTHGLKHGSRLSQAEVQQRFKAAFAQQEEQDRRLGDGRTDEARERRRWSEIVQHVFHDLRETEDLLDDLWEHFANPKSWRLYDDMPRAWRELAAEGYRLAVASNFDGRLPPIIQALPPLSECRHVYVSSLLGTRKPDPAFFAAVAKNLDCREEELLMVGDDPINDIRPAQAAGWRAIELQRDAKSNDSRCINSLSALPQLLRGANCGVHRNPKR